MALSKSRSSNRLVLDIGTSAVRICELAQTKSGLQLTKYYQREFGIEPTMDEADKQERRAQVLGALLKEAKIRAKKAVVAVPGQSVFTRNRPLPPVPEYKVTQIVRYEIQQQIPFSLNEIALDYQVLDRTEVGGYDVMMAAIKVDVVEKQLEVLNKVNRSIDIVDVSPLAAYNWLCHTGDFGEEGQCIAMVDMGATTTDIVIQKDNQFKFTRSLHVGGNDVTSAIASAFNMSFADAEKLKREKAFAPTGDPQRDGKGGEVTGRILGRLVGEINRSFAYFRSQPGGGPVTRVIITGGGACLKNIIPFLQRQLNVEVRIAQPLAGLAIAPNANEASEHPEQACVALGLALRSIDTVPIAINLIPPRVKEASKRKEQLLYWALTFVAILLIMASTIPATADKIEKTQSRIKEAKSILAKYDPVLINNPQSRSSYQDDLDLVRKEVDNYKKDVEELDDIRANQHFWIDEMHGFNDVRPNGVVISSIQTVVIGGATNTGKAARQAAAGGASAGSSSADPDENPNSAKLGGGISPRPRAGAGGGGLNIGSISSGGGGRSVGGVQGFPGVGPFNQVTEPNGISISGYAFDVGLVQDFERRLKEEAKMFIDGGIYLHVRDLAPVPLEELDAADPGKLESTSTSQSSEKKGDDDGGNAVGQAFASMNFGTVSATGSASGPASGVEIVKFRIEVQFLGKPIAFDQN